MKTDKPKKAPKVKILPKDKPMFMRENNTKSQKKNPQQPMTSKRLSK